MIDKNFPIWGNAFFIIFKNSSKFEYREFFSTIYAKRKFDPNSSTTKYLKNIFIQGLTDSWECFNRKHFFDKFQC